MKHNKFGIPDFKIVHPTKIVIDEIVSNGFHRISFNIVMYRKK
jgi:hypothetical protein